jgi:hypothetical protein
MHATLEQHALHAAAANFRTVHRASNLVLGDLLLRCSSFPRESSIHLHDLLCKVMIPPEATEVAAVKSTSTTLALLFLEHSLCC